MFEVQRASYVFCPWTLPELGVCRKKWKVSFLGALENRKCIRVGTIGTIRRRWREAHSVSASVIRVFLYGGRDGTDGAGASWKQLRCSLHTGVTAVIDSTCYLYSSFSRQPPRSLAPFQFDGPLTTWTSLLHIAPRLSRQCTHSFAGRKSLRRCLLVYRLIFDTDSLFSRTITIRRERNNSREAINSSTTRGKRIIEFTLRNKSLIHNPRARYISDICSFKIKVSVPYHSCQLLLKNITLRITVFVLLSFITRMMKILTYHDRKGNQLPNNPPDCWNWIFLQTSVKYLIKEQAHSYTY